MRKRNVALIAKPPRHHSGEEDQLDPRYRKRRACSRKREEQRWKMLGEEEQAAVCLMALSSGFVFA
ncbi:GATA transcription factor 16 isoform C [Glycine soja]|uniref:GATA transcription factor 16 isoform C n=1 Tax=Glycine soja TaxID=3848 RepID=A0A445LG24_GLYSO|nr:GATA transcription factor 16 isoform C [Glycine soja]